MAKPEWGLKRTCTTCGARFYDMNRDPITCPKCGAENEKEIVAKTKRPGRGARAEAAKKPAVVAAVEDEEVEEDVVEAEDADDEALMEDASDLGEDDEDMAEVMDHLEPGQEEE